jgi:AcrR family transcriptional regulator
MGRWEPDSKGRLQEAALALYLEHGFDQTTAAQIADQAGLTERTFFRHFADKREVLFAGSVYLEERIVTAVSAAPESAGALEAVGFGLQAGAAFFGEFRRDLALQRQAVIASNPELRERELAKLADWAIAIAAVLRERGVTEPQATLAAETGMAVLRVGLQRWASDENDQELTDIMRDAMADVRALAAGS